MFLNSLNRHVVCAIVSVGTILSAFFDAQGAVALWKLAEITMTLGLIAIVLSALFIAIAHGEAIAKFINEHINVIVISFAVFAGSITALVWYGASTALIGKRTQPVVTMDQAGLFFLASVMAGFCLSGFLARKDPEDRQFPKRMILGSVLMAYISVVEVAIVAVGGA